MSIPCIIFYVLCSTSIPYLPLLTLNHINTHFFFLCNAIYNEIEVKITLRPIRELYTIRDVLDSENSYPRIAPKLNTPEHAFYRFLQQS